MLSNEYLLLSIYFMISHLTEHVLCLSALNAFIIVNGSYASDRVGAFYQTISKVPATVQKHTV